MAVVVDRYPRALVALHWLTLLLLAAAYACIELRGFFPRGSSVREGLKDWHYLLGMTVFALVWVRAALRLRGPLPPPMLLGWQQWMAGVMHLLLYLFMIAMPLLGWALLSAEGKPPHWGPVALPALVESDANLAERVESWHETIGVVGYWLIGLHAAAALLHHYVLRDGTLRRMRPGRG
ncbi:MAG: cytochrome b/b6 domain-containing protein [Chiayiivirga sp.]|jgi:cytochrome b561|uniref:cytochrome b n=1 Tax=Chiayiivirga sp. TaxID=2041042 RepID=UPI0025BD92C2|nr:cytochrome b/b6 domain-containing protein [Chiayiivirga sp.]MCI1710304.1 cytochrome b/b6 domain-containing protein [Chiayiivirga sp.]MCI1728911.1 cytochrome b/b6 domain-containing protein [Chiayiivirga sp.]